MRRRGDEQRCNYDADSVRMSAPIRPSAWLHGGRLYRPCCEIDHNVPSRTVHCHIDAKDVDLTKGAISLAVSRYAAARVRRRDGIAALVADIRDYVSAVKQATESERITAPGNEEIERRAQWALAEADRIDTVKDGRFLQPPEASDSEQ
jgi:hypothetical protein